MIRKYANVMQCRGWEFHELHRDAAVMQVTARVRLHWAIPRKLRPGPGERRREREARVKRRRRRGSPAPFLGKIAGAIVHFSTSCTARPPKRIAARAASH